jgi:hypothetical protein
MSTGTTYFWRVRGKITNYNGPWSDVWKFTSQWGTDINENTLSESNFKLLFMHLCIYPLLFNEEFLFGCKVN